MLVRDERSRIVLAKSAWVCGVMTLLFEASMRGSYLQTPILHDDSQKYMLLQCVHGWQDSKRLCGWERVHHKPSADPGGLVANLTAAGESLGVAGGLVGPDPGGTRAPT